jgi:superfamily II DNA/RNA helicase
LRDDEKEIDLLLTTDVISEGQNLQTGNVVINYDIHWNPVRLIQRIGRVDRIGSKHDDIDVYNFLPDPELEKNLGLEAVVRKHIDDIQYVIGEDSKILTKDEKLNDKDLYSIYVQRDKNVMEEEGEDTPLSLERMEVLKEWLKEDDARENAVMGAQKGTRTARDDGGTEMAVIVLEAGPMKSFYRVKKNEEPEKIRQDEALALMECKTNEKIRELPDDMDEIVESTRDRFWKDYWEYHSKLAKIRGNTREQKWVKKSLSSGLKYDYQQLDRLRKQFNQGLPLTLLRELRRMQRKKISGDKLVIRLQELAKEYNLEPEPMVFQPHKARVLGAIYLW